MCVNVFQVRPVYEISHPEILILTSIRSSKHLQIHPKFRVGGILGNLMFRSEKVISGNYTKTFIKMIQSLMIRNVIS